MSGPKNPGRSPAIRLPVGVVFNLYATRCRPLYNESDNYPDAHRVNQTINDTRLRFWALRGNYDRTYHMVRCGV